MGWLENWNWPKVVAFIVIVAVVAMVPEMRSWISDLTRTVYAGIKSISAPAMP